jgi:hypothetical protein
MELSSEELYNVKNLLNMRDTVTKSENPHPFVVVAIAALIIMFMYCVYINVIKVHIGGGWVDDDDDSHIIYHDKWTDRVYIDSKFNGVFKGNLLCLDVHDSMFMGCYIDNQIKWMNGDIWHNVKKSRRSW